MLSIIGVWLDPTDDGAAHRAWVEDLWQQVRQHADGVYVNFLANEGKERVKDAYPPATYARLAAIKRAYDPDNRFRFNQNVRPADECG
jgi:FAD/FMN-containing dehydrogenase